MNFSSPLQSSFAMIIGWSIIHSLWIGAAILTFAPFLLRAIRTAKAQSRYVVFLLALLLIPVGSLACATLLRVDRAAPATANSRRGANNLDQERPARVDNDTQTALAAEGAGDSGTEVYSMENNDSPSEINTIAVNIPPDIPPDESRSLPFSLRAAGWIPWIVWAWMTGVAILSVRLLLGCVSLHKLSSSGTSPVSEEITRLVKGISTRIRLSRTVRVVGSTLAVMPATIGFFRPVVLLPLSTLTSLSAKELEAILAHELAHIHRGDFLVNLVQVVVEVLLFYHPAVWWLSRRIRQEREHACDDMAVHVTGNRLQYARALAAVAERTTHNRLALAAGGGHFSMRIHRILGRADDPRSSSLHAVSAGILAVILVGGAFALIHPTESTASAATLITQGAPGTGQAIKPIAGTILGPQGEPLSGVTVFLRRRPFRYHEGPVELAQLTTGENGAFEFRDLTTPDNLDSTHSSIFPLDVIATKAGYSLRWRRLSNAQTDISLQLKSESQYTGVLVDDAGEPVVNAVIRVRNLMSLNTITKIDVAGGHTPSANGDSYLDISESTAELSATTDREGKFALRHLPPRVGMTLGIDDRRYVKTTWYAATTDEALPKIPAGKLVFPPPPESVGQIMQRRVRAELVPIHSHPANLKITRGVRLRYHVVNNATSDPVAGATVTLAGDPSVEAITDQGGRCDLEQIAQNSKLTVKVVPPETTNLLGSTDSMTLGAELQVERTIGLKRGAIVSGQVRDGKSNGVLSVTVAFVPESGDAGQMVPAHNITDNTGAFRLVVTEVPGRVVVTRAPAGYITPRRTTNQEANRRGASAIVAPSLNDPIDGLAVVIDRRPAIPFQFVTKEGNSPRVTANVRLFLSSNSYQESTVEVDKAETLDAGLLVRGSRDPKAVQLLVRSVDDRLAAFLRSKDILGLQTEKPTKIVLRPTASVHGRIVDKETGTPIPEANVSLSVSYTATSGQGVARFTCDKDGKYEFDRLVPGMRYSLGAGAKGYATLNSIHTRFMAEDAKSHSVDIALNSRSPKPLKALKPVAAPSVEDLPPDEACDTLIREYATAKQAYRDLIKKHRSDGITSQIVSLREPTPAYAEAMMKLANDNRGSAIELKALKWLCRVSLVAGTEHRYRHLKAEAAARLLKDYRDRSEIADVVSSIIYASPDRYDAAEVLMKSPHHDVQGHACLTCANVLTQRYLDPYRGRQSELRARAIELYQKVIDDYSDISYWNNKSIATVAKNKLFELQDLQLGATAPEIDGVDLKGRPMKLSEFRGKVVVIHYWESGLAFFQDLKRIEEDYKGKPLVILGVNTDKDRDKAIAIAREKGLTIRHWHDPDRKIHARWSGSWPSTHVIGHDGKILYKGQRQSPQPLDDVLDQAVAAVGRNKER